jgi:hypothetical protein
MQTGRPWRTHVERCPTDNAIQDNKFVGRKIVIKVKCVLHHHETTSYLFVDFLRFLGFLEQLLRPQSLQVLEETVQF